MISKRQIKPVFDKITDVMKQSVVQFISDKRAEGKTEEEITHLLLDAGWQIDVIHVAMETKPVRTRDLTPILKPKKQLPKWVLPLIMFVVLIAGILFVALI